MSESFDINVLREEARTRWLRPAEVYYILQNHERFPITPEPPKKPPSGSLFLYNRRVNRYFRKDGHAWRRKRDGRTVGEAHERLKVGNVDALSCYYAHGEQNPCFQRRCFWMLEPAYEHIVLVQYREVAEGRYYSSQLSNGPPESLSSLSHPNAIHGNQYHSSASGTSEGSESHQSYSNLSSLTEVTSYSVNKEHNRDSDTLLGIPELGQTYLEQNSAVYQADNGSTANKSGLNVALKKIAEQLSLGDDDDDYIYSNQAHPLGSAKNIEAAADNQLKQTLQEGIQTGLGRNIAPIKTKSAGKRVRLFGDNLDKPCPSDGESSHDLNELSLWTPGCEKPREVAKWKHLHQKAQKSASSEEDSFDFDRPSPLIEKPHSTLYEDVNAWIALKKQCEGGCHHTCGQKVGPELVGRSDIKQMCMENILSDRNGETNYTVICINAGSCHGKTSLLLDLYNDQQSMDAFDKRIWIQISDKLDISMLFRKIVEFTSNAHCSITNLSYLQEMVEEEITDKKIVLFMDDADIEDQQFWDSTFKVLNASTRGSVIVMATRSATPAAHIGIAVHSYSLSPLSEEFNLVLLQQYAALGIDIRSHPDLVMVAKRLISRIGANPLNLKAIGGLLSHTDTISLQNHAIEENVMPLQLCHDVLPVHLKKCLAFCSLFPEGYIFDRHHIVLLWISNGCVRPVKGCELEHVGAEYFNELLCRSFFQNSPFDNGKDGKFVMHKLIYKVIESVSRSRYFQSEDLISSVPENIRHLSIASSQIQTVVKLMPLTENLKDLLTFLVVQPDWQQYRTYFPTLNLVGLDDFFLKFTSMETLDLSHTDIEELPGSIVSMRNLQYLCLNDTRIRVLPSELCSLSNLLTLKAKNCHFLTELPGDTKKLLKLRHLDVTKDLGYVHLPQGIGQLTELRTLPVFHASGDSSRCSISELGNLRSLRGFLCLSGLKWVKTSCKAQEVNLKHKQHLQDVTLQWHDGDADIDDDDGDEAENVAEQVLGALEPHANLQELAIRGYEGNAFPGWIQSPFSLPSLVSLTLDSCCNCTQFPSIAQLPSLKFLSVRKMYDMQRLSSAVNGAIKFPSLELLNLWEMYGLEELLEASKGDCPRLRKICISRCPDLKRLPCIPSMTELVVHCCHQLPDVPELASLSSLKIEGLYGVKSFSLTPAALPVLKKLEIRSCKELSWVYGLEALTTVQRLKITGCPKLVSPRTRGMAP